MDYLNSSSSRWENTQVSDSARVHLGHVIHNYNVSNEDQICLHSLRSADPRHDKKRIEAHKGGLLKNSYCWIFEDVHFQQWRHSEHSQLLWICGGPGKGKTMLLCGIVDELRETMDNPHLLSYFFCQATLPKNNNGTAVLRGLMYMLVLQQPSLIAHIRKEYDSAGAELFEGINAWVAVSDIFTNILRDPALNDTCLIIDAIDECVEDRLNLLQFIIRHSSVSSRGNWIISSRKEIDIEQSLQISGDNNRIRIQLEDKAVDVSHAVNTYINHCLSELPIHSDSPVGETIRITMQKKADNTFLWVSLVVKELKTLPAGAIAHDASQILDAFPTDLGDIYARMLENIKRLRLRYPELCQQVLDTVVAAYRPLRMPELHQLSGLSDKGYDLGYANTIVDMCGSFLTIQEGSVYIVHQSAVDFLSGTTKHGVVQREMESIHYSIFSRSIEIMSQTLRRDVYSLGAPGYPASQVETPDPDPLAASRYSCVYWVDHLHEAINAPENQGILRDAGVVHIFIQKKYLYWLEALSHCKSMTSGIDAVAKLVACLERQEDASALLELTQDAHRFIMSHKEAIETSPLQTYASALLFSPSGSHIKSLFTEEAPTWITMSPTPASEWNSCLHTFTAHRGQVDVMAFSYDTTRLASVCHKDFIVKMWDTRNSGCLQKLQGHTEWVLSLSFSNDATRLASGSLDGTVRIWDTSSGKCLRTLQHHSDAVRSVAFSFNAAAQSVAFSHNAARLISASRDQTIKIWDTCSAECLRTLRGGGRCIAFSPDSTWFVSGAKDGTTMIWSANTGDCLQTLGGHDSYVRLVAISPDSTAIASASRQTVMIWDTRGLDECAHKATIAVPLYHDFLESLIFSPDSTRLVAGFLDNSMIIWNANSGNHIQTLQRYKEWSNSIAYSSDFTRFASGSHEGVIKIWNISDGWHETIRSFVYCVAFSHDANLLASGFKDGTVEIWDAMSGEYVKTLQGHRDLVTSVGFSPCTTSPHFDWLASASNDGKLNIWDIRTGKCLHTIQHGGFWIDPIALSHDGNRLALVQHTLDQEIYIWDISQGVCLRNFRFNGSINKISFDLGNQHLHTNIGVFKINAPQGISGLAIPEIPEDSQSSRHDEEVASLDGDWISFNNERLAWLPQEYRSSYSSEVSGRMIAIVTQSGKLCLFKLGPNIPTSKNLKR